jgi:hypothetical protein
MTKNNSDDMVALARDHAIKVTAVIRHGHPRLDEPFAAAWRRALEALGVRTPALWRPTKLRERLLPQLPGDTEGDKLAYALGGATPAMRFFTNAFMDAEILGFDLVTDFAGLSFGRGALDDARCWPLLPCGTLQAGGALSEVEEANISCWEKSPPLITIGMLGDVPAVEVAAFLELLRQPTGTWLRRDRKLVRRLTRLIRDRVGSQDAA